MRFMDNKFKDLDITTIVKIAQTGEDKKVGKVKLHNLKGLDSVKHWMRQIGLSEGGVKVSSTELNSSYNTWASENGALDINIRMFGRIISKLLHKTRSKRGNVYFCNFNPLESVTNEEEKE